MKSLLCGLKAVYEFFAGDAILLSAVALAFALAAVLLRVHGGSNLLTAGLFVAIIFAGLVASLRREI
jgi:hypothetical protein